MLFVLPARWRGPAAAVGAGYACATAFATMSAGWHRAGDSLAAFLLVGAWVGIAGLAVVISGLPVMAEPAAPAARQRWPKIVAAGSLTAGLVIVLALYLNQRRLDGTAPAMSAFIAGGLLITGTATTVLIAVLALIDRVIPRQPAATT